MLPLRPALALCLFACIFPALFLVACVSPARQKGQELAIVAKDDHLEILVEGKLFTEYRFRRDQKYPYFFPLIGPSSGLSLTTESSQPYPHHHSLFFGCDRTNGGNYWQDVNARGQIVQVDLQVLADRGKVVGFQSSNLWERPGVEAPFRDFRRVRVSAPDPEHRLLDFEIRLTALQEVTIGRSNHALFAVRVLPKLAVKAGGHLVNATGAEGEKATFGQSAPWMDAWGRLAGKVEGIAILCSPANTWPAEHWFTRDYGFFSPTPMYWLPEGELRLPRGSTVTQSYRVVVHSGSATEAGIQTIYEDWVEANR